MVTYSQLRTMDTSKLSTASSTSGDLSSTLVTRAGQVRSAAAIPPGIWAAADADAAGALLEKQEPPLHDASDAFRTGKAALEDLVDGLETAKERLDDAHDLVAGTEVVINGDGSVSTPSVDDQAKAATNASLARQAAELIQEALRIADTADETASEAIQAASVDIDSDSIPNGDGDTPQDVHDWWNSLSEAQRHAYIQEHPDLIGNLDGIPAEARHAANMENLREDVRNGHDREAAQDLLNRVEESQHRPENERMYLLGYEPPGEDGNPDALVIAAIGNPDTADHTAVFVPGTSSDLGGMDGAINSMSDLRNEAVDVSGNENVSTIAWLGYDAPDDIPNAVRSDIAQEGAADLREFTRALDATNGDGHTSVIGHSYGSTVVGTADAMGGQGTDDGLVANDIIAVGSPGMGYESPDRQGFIDGPMVDDVSDMHMDDDHIWGGASASDGISYLTVHGGNPVDWSFGGQRFETDGAGGHSEYFNPGTDSLTNQAHIITGQYDEVETLGRRPK